MRVPGAGGLHPRRRLGSRGMTGNVLPLSFSLRFRDQLSKCLVYYLASSLRPDEIGAAAFHKVR